MLARRTTETANSHAFTQNAAAALATTSSQLPKGAPANSAPRATIVFAATTLVIPSRGTRYRGAVLMAGTKNPSTNPNMTANAPSSKGRMWPPATTIAKTTMINVRSRSEVIMVRFGPILSTKTPPTRSRRVAQLRNVERGETVGYGATWTARRPTRLAIVTAGYADGYFRAAGGVDGTRSAEAIIAGKRCPIAGRISMDLIAIDITDLPIARCAAANSSR